MNEKQIDKIKQTAIESLGWDSKDDPRKITNAWIVSVMGRKTAFVATSWIEDGRVIEEQIMFNPNAKRRPLSSNEYDMNTGRILINGKKEMIKAMYETATVLFRMTFNREPCGTKVIGVCGR